MRWIVEQSHMTDVPTSIVAHSIDELKAHVEKIKASKTHRPIGELIFRHERHRASELLYVSFVGHDMRKRRFMRLRRHTNAAG